jgi:hypothetical protein
MQKLPNNGHNKFRKTFFTQKCIFKGSLFLVKYKRNSDLNFEVHLRTSLIAILIRPIFQIIIEMIELFKNCRSFISYLRKWFRLFFFFFSVVCQLHFIFISFVEMKDLKRRKFKYMRIFFYVL